MNQRQAQASLRQFGRVPGAEVLDPVATSSSGFKSPLPVPLPLEALSLGCAMQTTDVMSPALYVCVQHSGPKGAVLKFAETPQMSRTLVTFKLDRDFDVMKVRQGHLEIEAI